MKYLNGHIDIHGNFNGCLTPSVLKLAEHSFGNDDLRLFQEFINYCLEREESGRRGKRPQRFRAIAKRFHSLSTSAQTLLLIDARQFERFEYANAQNL